MHAYMYTHMCSHTCTHTHAHAHAHTHTHAHTHAHTCTYMYTLTYTHIYTHTCTHTHLFPIASGEDPSLNLQGGEGRGSDTLLLCGCLHVQLHVGLYGDGGRRGTRPHYPSLRTCHALLYVEVSHHLQLPWKQCSFILECNHWFL